MTLTADIKPIERSFLPNDFTITTWDLVEPFFQQLLDRPINNKTELEQWLKDSSELEAVISEDACWRQVRMTCDTENKQLEEAFNYFYMEIAPKMQPYADKLNRKLVDCAFTNELDADKYFTYLRSIKKSIELFREANIPIMAEMNVMQQQFGQIAGKMTVEVNGKEYTLQQAGKFLENPDRTLREEVYMKIQNRRYQDREALNELFNKLVETT
jgi:oligoendopeptidase F